MKKTNCPLTPIANAFNFTLIDPDNEDMQAAKKLLEQDCKAIMGSKTEADKDAFYRGFYRGIEWSKFKSDQTGKTPSLPHSPIDPE